MSRLIDADTLQKEYKQGHDGKRLLLIDVAPTVDAVEVIRCKDCKWWDKMEDLNIGYCHAIKHCYHSRKWEISIYRTYAENFYCADAERRENEQTD